MAGNLLLWGLGLVGAAIVGRKLLAPPRRQAPAPSPGPEPKPDSEPLPAQCDPVDATTWPAGKLCVHDGKRFVLVDSTGDDALPEPEYVPGPVTSCVMQVLNDHPDPFDTGGLFTTDSHADDSYQGFLDESELHKLTDALIHDKNGAFVFTAEGNNTAHPSGNHKHGVALNAAQIDALRIGATVEAFTSYDSEHRHIVRIRCYRTRPGA